MQGGIIPIHAPKGEQGRNRLQKLRAVTAEYRVFRGMKARKDTVYREKKMYSLFISTFDYKM